MNRAIAIVFVGVAMLAVRGPCGDASAKDNRSPEAALPVGKWAVEFSNGVKEVCDIGKDGESSIEEPQRRSVGRAEVAGGSVVMTFGDDRVERWTPVGTRFVVEHWFPASRLPTVTPVLGIAERAR